MAGCCWVVLMETFSSGRVMTGQTEGEKNLLKKKNHLYGWKLGLIFGQKLGVFFWGRDERTTFYLRRFSVFIKSQWIGQSGSRIRLLQSNISPKGRKAIFISFDRWRLNHVTVAATPGRLSFRNSPPLIRLCSASAFDCRQSPATSILDRDTNSIMLGCTDRIHLCPPVALCSGATAALGMPQTPMHAGPRRWVKWVRRTQRPAHTPTMRSRLPPQHVIVTIGPIWPTRAREKKNKAEVAPRFLSLHCVIHPSVHSTFAIYHLALLSAEPASLTGRS